MVKNLRLLADKFELDQVHASAGQTESQVIASWKLAINCAPSGPL